MENIMKQIIASVLISFLLATGALAETCPAMMKQIDQMLAETKQLSSEQVKEIKALRAQGEEAFKEGNQEECQKLLSQAIELLG
jgi:hypothetical protein